MQGEHDIAKKVTEVPGAGTLDVSFVFATRDRGSQLQQTLDSYTRLDTGGISWELVVADNGSRDETSAVLARMQAKLPLITLAVAEPGQNRARNQAMSIVRGRLIIFTDDDVLPAPTCLQAYVAAARRWPEDAIFGACIKPRFPAGTPEWLASSQFKFGSTAFARYQPSAQEEPVSRHPYGPSFAVRARAIGDLRFPEHIGPQEGQYAMGGEGWFLRALAAQGHRFIHVPSAEVAHVIRPEQIDPAWLLQRANKKGRGQAYMPKSRRRRSAPQLAGAPLRLWLAVARSWIRWRLSYMSAGSGRQWLEKGIEYQRRLGELQERLQNPR